MKNNDQLLKNLSLDEKRVFSLLQKKGSMTKNEISQLTNIKLSRLNYIMEPMIRQNIIVKERIGASSGGRKPIFYSVNLRDFYIIGIDISIMYTQIIFTNLQMEVIHEEIFHMNESLTSELTVNRISEIIHQTYLNLKLERFYLLGVGVGAVGPLDVKNGVIKNPSNFYAPNWKNVPLKEMLEKKLKVSVCIENGANAGVAAETLFGLGKGTANVSYFNCGVGIRTGTVSSGNLIRTINDEEEGFGHMVVDINGKECRCGNYGCLECYSSINAILKRFSDERKKGRTTILSKSIEDTTYVDICRAAEEGDVLSKEIIRDAALIFGAGLANYIKLLTPDLVILSGPLNVHSKLFYDISVQSTLMRLHVDKRNHVIFHRGGYFNEKTMAIGAATMLVEQYLSNE